MTGSLNDGNLKKFFPLYNIYIIIFFFFSVIKRKKKNLRELNISPYHSGYFPDSQIRMTGYAELTRHYDGFIRHLWRGKYFYAGGARVPRFC
jgi:hypothetical protein